MKIFIALVTSVVRCAKGILFSTFFYLSLIGAVFTQNCLPLESPPAVTYYRFFSSIIHICASVTRYHPTVIHFM